MAKGRITKTVGKINDDIIEKYGLYEYRDKKIIQSMDLYLHIAKHRNEFQSIDSYTKTLSNIEKIISERHFVFF